MYIPTSILENGFIVLVKSVFCVDLHWNNSCSFNLGVFVS